MDKRTPEDLERQLEATKRLICGRVAQAKLAKPVLADLIVNLNVAKALAATFRSTLFRNSVGLSPNHHDYLPQIEKAIELAEARMVRLDESIADDLQALAVLEAQVVVV